MSGPHRSARPGAVDVVGVEPIFVVSDVARAVEHYERLGFTTSNHDAGYAFAHRNQLTIHLAGPGANHPCAGVDVVGPEDYEYGKREGSHADPDGNLIRFGSPLRAR
jgi:hypothetical protein